MVVGIDEAGQDDVVAQIDDGIGRGGQRLAGADGLDNVVAHKHPSAGNLAAFVIHRHE